MIYACKIIDKVLSSVEINIWKQYIYSYQFNTFKTRFSKKILSYTLLMSTINIIKYKKERYIETFIYTFLYSTKTLLQVI